MPDTPYVYKVKCYEHTFKHTDEGIEILKDLENQFTKRTFIGESPLDVNAIVANEGARSVVLYILSMIESLEEIENGRRGE